MTKKEMIKRIREGVMDDVTEWALRDPASLRIWVTEVLGLERKTKKELEKNFSAYLQED